MDEWEKQFIELHDGIDVGDEGNRQRGLDQADELLKVHAEEASVLLAKHGRSTSLVTEWLALDWGSHERQQSALPAIVANVIKCEQLADSLEGSPELVSIEDAADVLAVSTDHVLRLVKSGHLSSVQVGKRAVRFDLRVIRKFIADGGLTSE